MIAIVDYGVGNLFSLSSSLNYIDAENIITGNPDKIAAADKIILPGVGAFKDASEKLSASGLGKTVTECAVGNIPVLGICLGMQLLFEKSFEYGEHRGLSLIGGEISPIAADLSEYLKIPHIGWNSLNFKRKSPLLSNINEGDYVYYVHSYYAKNCSDSTVASSEYGIDITGIVQNGNIYGTQFHPEKSGKIGLKILSAFANLK